MDSGGSRNRILVGGQGSPGSQPVRGFRMDSAAAGVTVAWSVVDATFVKIR